MSAPDLNALLSMPLDDFKEPPAFPAGTFYGTLLSYEYGKSRQKQTDYVRYHFRATEAGADLTPDELQGVDLSNKKLYRDFYLTPDAIFMLKEFIVSCGISTAGRSVTELIPEVVGASVIMQITQRMDPKNTKADGTPRIFNDVASAMGRRD
jgi:hypothetical protein